MINFEQVTLTYPGSPTPAIADLTLTIDEGELVVVTGATGSGKSTLLGLVTALVPHFTGGRLLGTVRVAGRETSTHPPRMLADVVGHVSQVPSDSFVTDTVEDELAYGMESLGVEPPVMRRRVEETLDLLGLTSLRRRPLVDLSAGEAQRVAIGAALTPHPHVLVLDEPTSALDPPAAEEVLAIVARLVADLGLTVLIAEHRLERVVQFADRAVLVAGDGSVTIGPVAEVMRRTPAPPPVVELARLAGWDPPPLTVRDARRAATDLRQRIADICPPERQGRAGDVVRSLRAATVAYDGQTVLGPVDLDVTTGEVLAVMGRNGAGKSTLLSLLVGLTKPTTGRVAGSDPAALVPHRPIDLLYCESVAAECAAADREAGLEPGATRSMLARIGPDLPGTTHPRDLSEGGRLVLALAIMLARSPRLLLLDEPTRGLDYAAKGRLIPLLRALAAADRAIVLVTHDVELVGAVADRTVVLADGEKVTDLPARQALTASPAFAPQIAKVLAPLSYLTVSEVAEALRQAGGL
jgi:energy-coupling factor transport system ATP-binding protein